MERRKEDRRSGELKKTNESKEAKKEMKNETSKK